MNLYCLFMYSNLNKILFTLIMVESIVINIYFGFCVVAMYFRQNRLLSYYEITPRMRESELGGGNYVRVTDVNQTGVGEGGSRIRRNLKSNLSYGKPSAQ